MSRRTRFLTVREAELAATICAIMASNNDCYPYEATEAAGAQIGAEAMYLAIDAWLAAYTSAYREAWADAEAALRSGWRP